jgi:hypothetical protein
MFHVLFHKPCGAKNILTNEIISLICNKIRRTMEKVKMLGALVGNTDDSVIDLREIKDRFLDSM